LDRLLDAEYEGTKSLRDVNMIICQLTRRDISEDFNIQLMFLGRGEITPFLSNLSYFQTLEILITVIIINYDLLACDAA
jgi:hypothetical protein